MRLSNAALMGLTTALLATGATASAAPAPSEAAPASDQTAASAMALPGKWAGWDVIKPADNTPVHPESQAYFRYKNVKVVDGDLVIRSMRHCVAGAPTEKTKAHPAPCKSKDATKYSTGRVQKMIVPAGSANWRVTFRAKVPQGAAGGTRSALWMLNQPGFGYCKDAQKPTFGEIDVLEWYTSKTREERTTATTHLECDDNKHVSDGGGRAFVGNPATFHNWSVTRVGSNLTYRMDDKVVLRQTCNEGGLAGVENCAEILNAGWLGIMQGEVFERGTDAGFYAGPAWQKRFPTISFVIRNVKVEAL